MILFIQGGRAGGGKNEEQRGEERVRVKYSGESEPSILKKTFPKSEGKGFVAKVAALDLKKTFNPHQKQGGAL